MTDSDLELLKEAIEEGIHKGIEKIGVENLKEIHWFSITASETFSEDYRIDSK